MAATLARLRILPTAIRTVIEEHLEERRQVPGG